MTSSCDVWVFRHSVSSRGLGQGKGASLKGGRGPKSLRRPPLQCLITGPTCRGLYGTPRPSPGVEKAGPLLTKATSGGGERRRDLVGWIYQWVFTIRVDAGQG